VSKDHHHIDIQFAIELEGMPSGDRLRRWAGLALQEREEGTELVLRIVDEAEITALNQQYRGKGSPTNVLSFPYEALPGVETRLLGDIVICAPVVMREAIQQSKSLEAHWSHMVIHGVLHLLGYGHQDPDEAARMEQLEVRLLKQMGYSDPYRLQCGG
jgi:probable rRNA maturation factor